MADVSFGGGLHRRLAVDKGAHDRTYALLRRVQSECGEVRMVPSHDPFVWRDRSQEGD